MFRSLIYLAFAMLASSAIATAMATHAVPGNCVGGATSANASPALARTLAQQSCVAAVSKP